MRKSFAVLATALALWSTFQSLSSKRESAVSTQVKEAVIEEVRRHIENSPSEQVAPTAQALDRKEPKLGPEQLTAAVRDLSLVVLRNSAQKAQMNSYLAQPELRLHIVRVLHDPASLVPSKFHERTAALDVLYEGLKATDQQVASDYQDMAERILTAEIPREVAGNHAQFTQFFGDRVELAMTANAVSPELFARLKSRSEASNPEARKIFAQAKTLLNVYNVSL